MTDPTPSNHLIEYVRDSVVEFEFVDAEPIVRGVNAAFVERLGYDAGDIRGRALSDWIVPERLAVDADEIDALLSAPGPDADGIDCVPVVYDADATRQRAGAVAREVGGGALPGELSFGESDRGGNVVQVRLPRA
jgi:PAS domain-containing protein